MYYTASRNPGRIAGATDENLAGWLVRLALRRGCNDSLYDPRVDPRPALIAKRQPLGVYRRTSCQVRPPSSVRQTFLTLLRTPAPEQPQRPETSRRGRGLVLGELALKEHLNMLARDQHDGLREAPVAKEVREASQAVEVTGDRVGRLARGSQGTGPRWNNGCDARRGVRPSDAMTVRDRALKKRCA